jgi:predicted dehydrogenase
MKTPSFATGVTRRTFLQAAVILPSLAPVLVCAAAEEAQRRAAIIGHTGEGNYGHDLDLVFNNREGIQVVAVADPDAAGRAKAAGRSRALRQYADYREMLEKEKPHLVCVAPRWTGAHHAMALAALQAGAHLYLEKPITQTLAEADVLIATAETNGRKIAVAHQMRLAPNILALKAAISEGLIGELLEIRAHGKQDRRAGGEDLVVLGVHQFDLMRFFAGDPAWCSARILQNDHEITPADARPATENIGPVAGDEIDAEFTFASGVRGTFTSRGKNREAAGPWGMELVGSKGAVRILLEMIPGIYLLRSGKWSKDGKTDEWRAWEQDPTLTFTDAERGFPAANGRVVDDWLAAIRDNRDPVCSGTAATKALEMAMGVFAAGLSKGRVAFPLKNRQHPLKG